ncbi:hypothetical protein ACOME3_003012 [Neoechinorhynchus agilis]
MHSIGRDKILCLISTTSCFAPRAVDKLLELAEICRDHEIAHLINNAYGVQSGKIAHDLENAARVGRVDFVVQSTDKNFMVPVGGSVVFAYRGDLNALRKSYPGRASMAPSLDFLGVNGYKCLLQTRKEMYRKLKDRVDVIAAKYNERVLNTPNNPISMAMTLTGFSNRHGLESVTSIGSKLFSRHVTGCRVVPLGQGKITKVDGVDFVNFMSHHASYPHAYLNFAAAIGMNDTDIDRFCKKLDEVLSEYRKE